MAPPKLEIKGRVVHTNTPVVSARDWGFTAPQGLSADDVRMPNFVSLEKMMELVNDTPHIAPGGISIVNGVVKSEFVFAFADVAKQWKKTAGPNNVVSWQFQGGEVFLQTTIAMHILASNNPPKGDDLKRKRFALIFEHELLHVLDEIQVVRDWMPNEIKADDLVKKYLIDATPIPDSTYDHYFVKDNFTPWLKNGYWTPEHNRRAARRDSPAEYKEVNDKINEIESKIVNRK